MKTGGSKISSVVSVLLGMLFLATALLFLFAQGWDYFVGFLLLVSIGLILMGFNRSRVVTGVAYCILALAMAAVALLQIRSMSLKSALVGLAATIWFAIEAFNSFSGVEPSEISEDAALDADESPSQEEGGDYIEINPSTVLKIYALAIVALCIALYKGWMVLFG